MSGGFEEMCVLLRVWAVLAAHDDYWLGKEFWGRGVATKALALLLDRVQERPLHARVAKSNVGSLRVVQACGFAIAGEDRFPDHNGAPVEEFLLKLG